MERNFWSVESCQIQLILLNYIKYLNKVQSHHVQFIYIQSVIVDVLKMIEIKTNKLNFWTYQIGNYESIIDWTYSILND